jgi:hypothetical protein
VHHKYILSIPCPTAVSILETSVLVGVDQAAIRKDTKRVVREKLSISNMSTDQQHLPGSVLLLRGQWNHDTTRVTAPEALSPPSLRKRSREEFTSPSRDPQKRPKKGKKAEVEGTWKMNGYVHICCAAASIDLVFCMASLSKFG